MIRSRSAVLCVLLLDGSAGLQCAAGRAVHSYHEEEYAIYAEDLRQGIRLGANRHMGHATPTRSCLGGGMSAKSHHSGALRPSKRRAIVPSSRGRGTYNTASTVWARFKEKLGYQTLQTSYN
jgi:hypothetical protein